MFDDCAECSSGKLCQLPDFNPDSESDSDFNSDSDISCLVSFYRWETPDKRHIYLKRSHNRHYNHIKESQNHCLKSVQIRSFFWSVFSCILVRLQENTDQCISPYLDTFHGVNP